MHRCILSQPHSLHGPFMLYFWRISMPRPAMPSTSNRAEVASGLLLEHNFLQLQHQWYRQNSWTAAGLFSDHIIWALFKQFTASSGIQSQWINKGFCTQLFYFWIFQGWAGIWYLVWYIPISFSLVSFQLVGFRSWERTVSNPRNPLDSSLVQMGSVQKVFHPPRTWWIY